MAEEQTETTEEVSSVETPETAGPSAEDLATENVELRAALTAYGVEDVDTFLNDSVTYKRDGTPVCLLYTSDAADE